MKPLIAGAALFAGVVVMQVDWSSFAAPSRLSEAAPPAQPAERVAANGIVEGARPEIAMRLEVAGRLTTIAVRENAEVKRGAVLAELENSSQKHQVALEAAELARARADLEKLRNGERPEKKRAVKAAERAKYALFENARATYDRTRPLLERRAISREEWDRDRHRMQQAEAEWDQARAELELVEAPSRKEDIAAAEAHVAAAEARLAQARAEFAKTRLVAPCNGRVLQVFAEPGEMGGPTSAQPVLILADLSKRRVRAFVEELDVVRIQAGQQAVVAVDALPGKEIAGVVQEVFSRMGKRSPQSDAPGEYKDVHYREVLIELIQATDLPVNLRVRVQIETGSETSPRKTIRPGATGNL